MIQEFRPEPQTDIQAILDIQDPDLRMLAALIAYRREKMQEQKAQKYDAYLADLQRPIKQAEARKSEQERRKQEPFIRQRQELARKVFR